MLKIFSSCNTRMGLSLIEVVAAISILSAMLTAILLSYRVHVMQIHAAKERLIAIEYADQLLASWIPSSAIPRIGQKGQTDEANGMSWRIVEGDDSKSKRCFGSQIVRLEIFVPDRETDKEVLTSVELIAPLKSTER